MCFFSSPAHLLYEIVSEKKEGYRVLVQRGSVTDIDLRKTLTEDNAFIVCNFSFCFRGFSSRIDGYCVI